jgi:hypothetical protein
MDKPLLQTNIPVRRRMSVRKGAISVASWSCHNRALPQEFIEPLKAARVHALIRSMGHTGLPVGNAVPLEHTQIRQDAERREA